MGLSFKYPKPDYKNQTAKTDDLLLLRSIHEYYQNSNTQLLQSTAIDSNLGGIRDFYYVIVHSYIRKAEKKQPVPLWDKCVQNNHKTPQFSPNYGEDKVPSASFHIDSRQYEFFSASKPEILKNIKKLFAYRNSLTGLPGLSNKRFRLWFAKKRSHNLTLFVMYHTSSFTNSAPLTNCPLPLTCAKFT